MKNLIFPIFLVLFYIVLTIFDVIPFNLSTTLGFALISTGLLYTFEYFGEREKWRLFLSSAAFLLGLILVLDSFYNFYEPAKMMLPLTLFIVTAGFLLIFLEDSSEFIYGIIAASAFILSIVFFLFLGEITFTGLMYGFLDVLKSYWIILVIFAAVLFYFYKSEN